MKIITIASLKGGVGKTTLAIYFAASLARKKKKVLLIDADPNNNLTDFFLRSEDLESLQKKSLYSVLKGRCSLSDSIRTIESGLSVIPTTPELAKAQIDFGANPGTTLRFQNSIKSLDLDFVIFDTPPSLSYELYLALYNADHVLCPIGFSRWTIQGYQLIADACLENNINAPICVPFNVSKKDSERISEIDLPSTKTSIPKSAEFAKSAINGKLSDKVLGDFNILTKEILK
ncbi:ParA family protein [Leptospira meyeri]|uniref:ParA family protein n=1 Tax=Leptospira meyeri TaxID=29508 RepID=UPI00108475CB|nr:ParA family protein [Leptospira meyeri]TGM22020.1 ParA family protein [Leptospira meyeri]